MAVSPSPTPWNTRRSPLALEVKEVELPKTLPKSLPAFEHVATGDRFTLIDYRMDAEGGVRTILVLVNAGPSIEVDITDFMDALMSGRLDLMTRSLDVSR